MQVKQNQIWKCGEHILGVGDCCDEKFVRLVLRDKKINSIQTDSPFGVSLVQNKAGFASILKKKEILNDNITDETKYKEFTKKYLQACIGNLSEYNSVYIFSGDKMMCAVREAFRDLKINFSQLVIWVKNQPVIGRKDYLMQHELIYVGWYGKHKWRGSKDKSVLFFPKPSRSPHHPSTKPLELISKLILNTTEINGVVYDPFLGSGTTLIACEKLHRKCIGLELDLEYAQFILERWSKFTGKTPELIYEERQNAKT